MYWFFLLSSVVCLSLLHFVTSSMRLIVLLFVLHTIRRGDLRRPVSNHFCCILWYEYKFYLIILICILLTWYVHICFSHWHRLTTLLVALFRLSLFDLLPVTCLNWCKNVTMMIYLHILFICNDFMHLWEHRFPQIRSLCALWY